MAKDQLASDVVCVVVPAYNEDQVIGDVILSLREHYSFVVVVDDGSTDQTGEVAAAAGAHVLRHVVNRGQGASLQTGIVYALRCQAEYVVTYDADGQHKVEDIQKLLDALRIHSVDFALGSRFLESAKRVPIRRRVLLWGAILFTRLTTGLRVTDTHNGLRAMTHRGADSLDLRLDRMAHASEIFDGIKNSGFSFVEVPVEIRYTDYSVQKGQSSWAAFRIAFDYCAEKYFR